MFEIIWNLIPDNIKIGVGIALASIILIIGGVYTYQSNKINSLNTQLITCSTQREYEKAIYKDEIDKAHMQLYTQNEYIREFKLDMDKYSLTLKEKEIELSNKQIYIQKTLNEALSKDSSSDNQLSLITGMLKEFSNENP